MTLVILAAGMGSRYGGLKQIDPITAEGEFIIDFSVYDAALAGFDKVVFVIKRENLELFRETIGKRFENKIKVEYAFQELTDIPSGFSVPEGRVKPWGTAHALLAARDVVDDAFMVINSDDFYGRSAYRMLFEHFAKLGANEKYKYAMVGYILENTLTETGTVSRGICSVNEASMLTEVEERTEIRKEDDMAAYKNENATAFMPLRSVASMNCWGFTPDIFDKLSEGFAKFLSEKHSDELKCEYYLPFAVCDMLKNGECEVKVYASEDSWYGVTYKEDKPFVVSSIVELKKNGIYPQKLNG